MEIAIYGGTFDPPTKAHEAIIAAAAAEPSIDEVWVMPSADRADKPYMTNQEKRMEMLEIVKHTSFAACTKVVLSPFELCMQGLSQTCHTVEALQQAYPEYLFRYIFGVDSYIDMPNWKGGGHLRATLPMFVVARAGYVMPSISARVQQLDVPHIEEMALASRHVRTAVAAGQTVTDMVSEAIAAYIHRNGLYNT